MSDVSRVVRGLRVSAVSSTHLQGESSGHDFEGSALQSALTEACGARKFDLPAKRPRF
jgi:hypothetical protein